MLEASCPPDQHLPILRRLEGRRAWGRWMGVGVGAPAKGPLSHHRSKAPQRLKGPQYWILTVGEGDTRAGRPGPIVNLPGPALPEPPGGQ